MELPPDAAALIRAFLERPTDETPRLVLADWLDDSGLPENTAWAAFIRSRCQASRLPAADAERTALLRKADQHVVDITATLTVPAESVARGPAAFLDLLPADRLTISLDGYTLPPEFAEVVPESVARECRVVPLSPLSERLFLATADPTDSDNAQRLEFILNRAIVFLRAAAGEIDRAIDASYPFTMVESVTEELLIFPDPPVYRMTDAEREQTTTQFVNLVLLEAVRRGATWVEVRPETADAARVWFRVGNEWHGRDTIERPRLGAMVTRLAQMGGLAARDDGTYSDAGGLAIVADGTPARFSIVIEPTPFGHWVGIERVREPSAGADAP
ncbi:MAG: TIGR02996 domain-containing protein [Gemmataceae bacterium]